MAESQARSGCASVSNETPKSDRVGAVAAADLQPGANRPKASRGSERSADAFRKAIAYLRKNFTEPITLGDLEAVTGCSMFRIIRAFRSEVGTTPHAYIMELRVRQATVLLDAGQHIIEAAADAGFADQSHFTKHFKRVYGITPGEYQRAQAARQTRRLNAQS